MAIVAPGTRTVGDETRHRVLDEAQTLFSEWGYVGTTVQQVADKLGITKAALYYHFPQGKEEIFVELMRRHIRRLHQALEQALRAGATTRERLEGMADQIAAHAPSGDVEKLRRDLIHLDEAHRASLKNDFCSLIIQTIAGVLRQGVERGELRDHDSEFVTWVFFKSVCTVAGDCPSVFSLPADAPRAIVSLLLDGISATTG